jgi:hypothetical protein
VHATRSELESEPFRSSGVRESVGTSSLAQSAGVRSRTLSTPRSYELLARWLDGPRAVAWIALAIFVMSLPAMATGLCADDYWIEEKVQDDPWGAFAFTARDPELRRVQFFESWASGRAPWFMDENYALSFMRPLTSLTHAIDFRLWPNAVPLMHLENIVIYVFVVWLAGLIYIELGLPRLVVGFSTLFYAVSGTHSTTMAWLSGRNTLLTSAFGLLAIWLHLRAASRFSGARVGLRLAAAVALAVGLSCGEFAASAPAFLLAYELTLSEGSWARRILALVPYALVLAGWLIAYVAGGFGPSHSGFYHMPFREPGAFALGLVTGLPIYVATQLAAPIASFSVFFSHGLAIVTALAILMLFLMRGLLLPLWRANPRARFLLLGAALATIPLAGSPTQERLVFFVSLGTSAVVALIVTERFDSANVELSRAGVHRLYRIHAVWLLAMYMPLQFVFGRLNAGGGANALADALASTTRGVVLINAPAGLNALQDMARARRGLPKLPFIDGLYEGGQAIEVRRPTLHTLDVRVERGYFTNSFERLMRDPARSPFHAGDVVQLPRMRVTVMEVNAGGAPTLVRFDFPDALERLGAEFWVWDRKVPKPWLLPAVGASVAIAGQPAFL